IDNSSYDGIGHNRIVLIWAATIHQSFSRPSGSRDTISRADFLYRAHANMIPIGKMSLPQYGRMNLYDSPFVSFPMEKLTDDSHQRQAAIVFLLPNIPHRAIFTCRIVSEKIHIMYSNIWFIRRIKSKKEPKSGLFVRSG
ncbi:hypothetical protein, partial [Methanoregula sp.]|uniref:hypothetical protein n=1 Tax=Methanoregula sp. TaxID=2052170 RepID=UPI000CC05FEA